MIILYYHSIIASALFSLYLGIYTFISQKYSYLNRSFFRLALLLCLISLSTYFAVSVKDGGTSRTILSIVSLLWFLFPLVFLKFIVILTEKRGTLFDKRLPWSLFLPVILYIANLKYNLLFDPFKKTDFGWAHYYNTHSPLFIITFIYYVVYISASLILLAVWGHQNSGTIKQYQAKIILISTLLLSLLVLIYRKIFFFYFHIIVPPLFPVFLNIWLGSVAYTIIKFHLMSNISRMVQNSILSHISDMVIILDIHKKITYINERALQISGFKYKEIMFNTYDVFFPDTDFSDMNLKETCMRTKTGTTIPVQLNTEVFKDARGFVLSYIMTASDIRILKTLQQQIHKKEETMLKFRESEKKYSTVFNASPAGLVFFKLSDGTVLEINSMALNIAGYTRNEILCMDIFLKSILVKNNENRKLIHDIREMNPIINRNCIIVTKNKEKRTLLVSIEYVNLKGDPCLLLACSDITESQKIKTQLIRAQKLDSIGILAGGIAHDFNNMLAVIKGNISLALHETANSEIKEYLTDALKASSNAANLTNQLLAFSRGKKAEKAMLDIREVIDTSIAIAFSGKDAVPVFYSDAQYSTIYGNKIQLQQIFINLFINALQASEDKGEVTISTTNDKNNKKIIISVTDFGKGIPDKNIDTIFDPFFSTKNKGTGLGLSIVYSVVHNHQGTIEVVSSVKEGTTFTITFPLYKTLP